MNKKSVNEYLTVAEEVAEFVRPYITSKQPFTCHLFELSTTRSKYIEMFELNSITDDNEQDLWYDTPEFRKERRLLMLCLAAAIEASGGL